MNNNNVIWDLKNELTEKEKKENVCLHRQCPECKGTGGKKDGIICIHMISCPCKGCTPYRM